MGGLGCTATFRVADWQVEPRLNRVSRGSEVHHLRPRLMDLLVFLADHPGDVLSRDQILSAVWPQRFVAESVLSRSVADLRRLLDDDASMPRLIETIPKRGYRLLAAVRPPAPPAVAAAPGPSIAVLPFVDMAAKGDQGYFCDGLAEELTNALAHVPGLRVVARTSAFAFKGQAVDVREIGRRLGVGFVLEGGVQRAGHRFRVTIQLVDTADGCHRWSQHFDGAAGEIFAIEDAIARAVAAALPAALPAPKDRRMRRGSTRNPAAHDLYLRGRHQSAQRTPDALARALGYFEEALGADPDYAAALAAIAECHCVSGFVGYAPPAEAFPLGRAAAERALAIDPEQADAHAALGHESGMYEWHWQESERHFRSALALNPGHALARVWFSHLLAASGRFDEAIEVTERACEIDPLSPTVETTLGLALHHAGEHERAVACYLRVLDATPAFALARLHLGRAYAGRGQWEAAAAQFELAAGTWPLALGFLAGACRRLGLSRRVGSLMAELERLSCSRYVGPLSWFAAWIGEREAQRRWLVRAFDEHEGAVPLLNSDPCMDGWREDAGARALFDRLDLPRVPPSGSPTHAREVPKDMS
ncbi:MAG: winged helix-turn-helix domain-containing protein [Vicinamibacterales bacterium]